jgi:hypothetical protein
LIRITVPANHREKRPKGNHYSNSVVRRPRISHGSTRNSRYPETSAGEVVSPKSTLKRSFGTGKDSEVTQQKRLRLRGPRSRIATSVE